MCVTSYRTRAGSFRMRHEQTDHGCRTRSAAAVRVILTCLPRRRADGGLVEGW